MIRLRLLVWLVALLSLAVPPVMAGHARASTAEAAMVDCPDHAPPPPCPDEGTAKHAASACCPLMGGAVAVLLPEASMAARPPAESRAAMTVLTLAGRLFTKDPPPPRA